MEVAAVEAKWAYALGESVQHRYRVHQHAQLVVRLLALVSQQELALARVHRELARHQ